MKRLARLPARAGFALVEVMIAVVMLGIVVSSLAAVAIKMSTTDANVAGKAYSGAIMAATVNRLLSTPFSSLTAGTTTGFDTAGTYADTQKVTITSLASDLMKIQVVLRPNNPRYSPDTTIFLRSNPAVTNVLGGS